MKKFKISEEQYKMALSEGITLSADVSATNGDVSKAVENTKQQAIRNGVNLKDATIQMPADTANESKIISKKQLTENRLKVFKENSKLYSISEFGKIIK